MSQTSDRWLHEARRVGVWGWFAPFALAVGGGGFLGVLAAVSEPAGRTAGSLLEAVLPLGASVSVAALAERAPAVELQLSLPASYPATLARRCVLIVGVTAVVALAFSAALRATGTWHAPTGFMAGQLAWLVPLLALCALAAAAAALAASGRAAAALVAALWTGEEWFKNSMITNRWSQSLYLFATARADQPPYLVHGRLTDQWLANRAALLALVPVLVLVAYAALRRPHRLLGGSR